VENWDEVTKTGLKFKPQKQTLNKWINLFKSKVMPQIKKDEKLCFIGHSLGPVFILHLVDQIDLHLDSAIFISPFLGKLGNKKFWQIDVVNNTFYKTDFNFKRLQKLIPVSYVLYSDNDPYVHEKNSLQFAKALNSSQIYVKKAGHMNSEVNLNEFPLVFDLCTTRLDLSLYQQFIKYRSEHFAADYLTRNKEPVLHMKPQEIIEEGKFHFENLKAQGFCTFWSDLPAWNPNDQYYEACRHAAGRIKNLIRVVLVKKLPDLNRPLLLEQIKLDFRAGIRIYLCMFEKIEYEVTDPDFGIWDYDYLCTIHYNSKKEMNDIILSSKNEDLKRAKKWENYILERSTEISNTDKDIKEFIIIHTKESVKDQAAR
jgi:predicted alpha/beta hydrolase family esterase